VVEPRGVQSVFTAMALIVAGVVATLPAEALTDWERLGNRVRGDMIDLGYITSGADLWIPTVENTSMIRDYVYQLQQGAQHQGKPVIKGSATPLEIHIALKDATHSALCGGLSKLLWGIYKAFGYRTTRYSYIDNTFCCYSESHAVVDVAIPDLNRYIVQDPTFNVTWKWDEVYIGVQEIKPLLVSGANVYYEKNGRSPYNGMYQPIDALLDRYLNWLTYIHSVIPDIGDNPTEIILNRGIWHDGTIIR